MARKSQKQIIAEVLIQINEGDLKNARKNLENIVGGGADKATGAILKTTRASQEVVRIVQDAGFGMMGMTNNIQSLAEAFADMANKGFSFGESLKATMKSVLTGPMAISFFIAALTTVITHWDSIIGGIDKARHALGLITDEAKLFRKEIEKGKKTAIEMLVGDDDDLEAAIKRLEVILQSTFFIADRFEGPSPFLRNSILRAMALFGDEKAVEELERVGFRDDLNDAMKRKLFELRALRDALAEAAAHGILPPEEDEKEDKKKKRELTNRFDVLRAIEKQRSEGHVREIRMIQINRAEALAELEERRKEEIMTDEQFFALKEEILIDAEEAFSKINKKFHDEREKAEQAAIKRGLQMQKARIAARRRMFQQQQQVDRLQAKNVIKVTRDGTFARMQEDMNDQMDLRRLDIQQRIDILNQKAHLDNIDKQMRTAHGEELIRLEEQRVQAEERIHKQRLNMIRSSTTQAFSTLGSASASLFQTWKQQRDAELTAQGKSEAEKTRIIQEEGKNRFKFQKALMIADATVNTLNAGVAAYNAGVKIGGPAGLAVGGVMMAAALASGFAQVKAIKATTIGGSTTSTASTGAGKFVQLSAAVNKDRAQQFIQTNASSAAKSVVQSSRGNNGFDGAVDRFVKAADNLRVTIDDPTSAQVVARGQARNQRFIK